jgi:type VI secretion system secreted protein Hcp
MALDMFLDIDTVKGEAKDKQYKDKIDILAWSWGASNSGSAHVGGGMGSGKANFQDISVTKYIDLASTTILGAVSKGKHFPKAKLIVRKAGGDKPVDYYVIEMEDVMVTSYSTGGSGGEDRLTENVTLNFAKFKAIYTPQDKAGAGAGNVPFEYNIAENA